MCYENLESRRVCDLDNPSESLPVDYEIASAQAAGKWICSVCGYIYDPETGDPDRGFPPGTEFEDLPADGKCLRCPQGKDIFNKA